MKSILKNGLVALTLVTAATVVATGVSNKTASAEEISARCKIRPHTGIVENGKTVSIKVYIEPDCPTQHASLMVYKTTAKIFPVSTQQMFSYSSAPFGPGEHTLTTNLPDDCYYQADLFRGHPVTQLEDTADYSSTLMHWRLGGSKDCVTVVPPVTPPATPAAVVTTVAAPAPKPETLPVTGSGSIAGIAGGISVISGLGYSIVSRIRSRS